MKDAAKKSDQVISRPKKTKPKKMSQKDMYLQELNQRPDQQTISKSIQNGVSGLDHPKSNSGIPILSQFVRSIIDQSSDQVSDQVSEHANDQVIGVKNDQINEQTCDQIVGNINTQLADQPYDRLPVQLTGSYTGQEIEQVEENLAAPLAAPLADNKSDYSIEEPILLNKNQPEPTSLDSGLNNEISDSIHDSSKTIIKFGKNKGSATGKQKRVYGEILVDIKSDKQIDVNQELVLDLWTILNNDDAKILWLFHTLSESSTVRPYTIDEYSKLLKMPAIRFRRRLDLLKKLQVVQGVSYSIASIKGTVWTIVNQEILDNLPKVRTMATRRGRRKRLP